MKITCVSHYYTPHVGGLEIVAEMQAKSLSERGHTVSVVTFAGVNETVGVSDTGGISVSRVRACNFFDTFFSIPFPIGGIGLFTTLWREIRNSDVVHIHDVFYHSSWVAYLCAWIQRKPVVLTQHVGMVEHTSSLIMLIQRCVYATIGKRIFSYAKSIVAYNPHVRDFLIANGVMQSKILELRNGIDTSLFHPGAIFEKAERRRSFNLPVDRPLVLFVGRLVPKKGFCTLFKAYDEAYDLVFVGSGEVPAEWLKKPRFHFLGPLSQERLAELYRAVDVFVFPGQGEIFTLVMQEAMASGLPVIASEEKEYSEYDINRELFVFCKPTPEELRNNIQRLVHDDALCTRMGEYSLLLAKQLFNWDQNVESLLRVYERVVETKRPTLVTTSWDDGHVLDQRLAELLKKYGVKGTFYIAPHDREFDATKRLTDEGIRSLMHDFEIGAHTMTHRHLPTLSLDEAKNEIVDSKHFLETLLGKAVTSFCYPAGKYLKEHTKLVEEAGFSYARTVDRFSLSSTDTPYERRTSVHTYNHWTDLWKLMKFVHYNPVAFFRYFLRWDAQAIALFDRAVKEGGVFHLWGHSWEIEQHNDWGRLEAVLAYIGGRPDVVYVTNGEQAAYEA